MVIHAYIVHSFHLFFNRNNQLVGHVCFLVSASHCNACIHRTSLQSIHQLVSHIWFHWLLFAYIMFNGGILSLAGPGCLCQSHVWHICECDTPKVEVICIRSLEGLFFLRTKEQWFFSV